MLPAFDAGKHFLHYAAPSPPAARSRGPLPLPSPARPASPPSRPLAEEKRGALPRGVKDALRRPARCPP